ncbi:hypothetical protein Tco_0477893 [Tanacetum coccineum]
MSPEWDRFVIAIKLNKVLKETNHEQLYAYLKQHDKHAVQDRLIIERITPPTNDPLAFVSSVQPYSQPSQKSEVFARGNGAAGFGGTQNRVGNANACYGKPIKCYNSQENGAMLDEEELLFLVGEQPNTFDADVDNQPSIFMANLSSPGPTNLQASSSDASILFEVPDLENANVASNNDQVEHEIHNEVQQSTVIDSNNADIGNSNVIPYEQYLATNDVSVVPSCASSTPNNAYVLIDNNVHTPNEPLVTELAIYKEQVAIYEQRAKFKLIEREQRMDD